MAVIDVSKVDTTPGNDAVCPFLPEGWEGDSAAYVELMRSRYRHLMHGQRMMVTASFARRSLSKLLARLLMKRRRSLTQ